MKKILVRSLIVLVVLIIVAGVVVGFFLGDIVEKGIETIGPKIAKVDIKVDNVYLSLLFSSARVKGLIVGNPEGYKAAQAIRAGSASVSVDLGTVLKDKFVVRSIRVEAPEITFEGNPLKNNLSTILDNVNASIGGGDEKAPKTEAKAGKKLQVDEFIIKGGKVHVGSGPALPLPDIHLTNLGTGPEGITPADLTQRVLSEVVKGTLKAVAGGVTDIGKGAGKTVTEGAEKVGKSIGDLFKKKE